jgi:predicted amidohydrolase
MKIALLQTAPRWEDPAANLERAARLVREAGEAGADLAVLPEMCTTGFTMDVSAAHANAGEAERPLGEMARAAGVCLVAGYAVRTEDGVRARNLAGCFDRTGGLLGRYQKTHLFPLAGEDRAFERGMGPALFEIAGVQAGVFVCYDLRFPEDFLIVAPAAPLLLVIANWPAARALHWETLLRARAIECQSFVAGVNRTGRDGAGTPYHGQSMVLDPMGETVARGGGGEEVVICEIDPAMAADVRARFPFLRDRVAAATEFQ